MSQANLPLDEQTKTPMSEIKRYGISRNVPWYIKERPDGDFVTHGDHLARIAQLEAQAQKLRDSLHEVSMLALQRFNYDAHIDFKLAVDNAIDLCAQKKAGEA